VVLPNRTQDVFTFEHPNRAHAVDNSRYVRLRFDCTPPGGTGALLAGPRRRLAGYQGCRPHPCSAAGLDVPVCQLPNPCFNHTPPPFLRAVCHGFAGYFDAQLYKDVHLSIHPPTHTPNMFSWFPIYFPLRTPFYVPPGV
jgi:protein arginine N-methyltransferase 5